MQKILNLVWRKIDRMSVKLSELLLDKVSMNLTLGDVKAAKLKEAVRRVHLKFPPVDEPDLENLEERLSHYLKRFQSESWQDYKLIEASSLARDFFGDKSSMEDKRWKLIKKDFLKELLNEKKSLVRGCFNGYLYSFKERSSSTRELANVFERLSDSAFGSMLTFVQKFDAVRPKGLPDRIAKDLLEHEKPYDKVKELGVATPHTFALFDDVFIALIELLAPKLKQADKKAFSQVKNWLRPNLENKMGAGYHLGIQAILEPFIKSDPDNETKKDLLTFLVDNYGDPRLETIRWAGVNKDCIDVVHRWLTGESLKTFFKIISRFDGSDMWEPRRVFWEMLYDRGWIRDAWPILNPEGVRYARELAAKDENSNFLSGYGKINETYEDQTCYFAMKIGKLLVVEGSHSFAIRFFQEGNRSATQMYNKSYSRTDLVIRKPPADERITHNGDWQSRAEKYLLINR